MTACGFLPEMTSISCDDAITAHSRMIRGIARRAHRKCSEDRGYSVCEVEDIISEIHIRLYRRWDSIVAVARDLRTYLALESRRAAWRYIQRCNRQSHLPVDMMTWDEIDGDD